MKTIFYAAVYSIQNPHCNSDNTFCTNFCKWFFVIPPSSFSTTSSRVIPSQFPFLVTGIRMASYQSCGTCHQSCDTCLSFQTTPTKSVSMAAEYEFILPTFNITSTTCYLPTHELSLWHIHIFTSHQENLPLYIELQAPLHYHCTDSQHLTKWCLQYWCCALMLS